MIEFCIGGVRGGPWRVTLRERDRDLLVVGESARFDEAWAFAWEEWQRARA